jgi:ribosomal protein L37AE/L43A
VNGERDSSTATDPTEADTCPGCGATHGVQRITGTSPKVQAWTCTACGLHWATTTVNPDLSIVGLLPTPQLRTAALMAVRTEVWHRPLKPGRPPVEPHPRAVLPAAGRSQTVRRSPAIDSSSSRRPTAASCTQTAL